MNRLQEIENNLGYYSSVVYTDFRCIGDSYDDEMYLEDATDDILWLIEQVSKYQELEKAWNDGINNDEPAVFFLRKCKETFEDFEPDTRKSVE